MTSVRAAAQRRRAKRFHHAAAACRAFYDRGESGWQQYLREGNARPLDAVFDGIDARVDARRREITWSVGAELARGATHVTFPSAPPAQDWDWESPRLDLHIKPADLDDDEQ
jgi:hypothetical protein